jgi:hypothetical protein
MQLAVNNTTSVNNSVRTIGGKNGVELDAFVSMSQIQKKKFYTRFVHEKANGIFVSSYLLAYFYNNNV